MPLDERLKSELLDQIKGFVSLLETPEANTPSAAELLDLAIPLSAALDIYIYARVSRRDALVPGAYSYFASNGKFELAQTLFLRDLEEHSGVLREIDEQSIQKYIDYMTEIFTKTVEEISDPIDKVRVAIDYG